MPPPHLYLRHLDLSCLFIGSLIVTHSLEYAPINLPFQ